MADNRLRILLVYHAAAMEPSRKLFAALAAHADLNLRVLAPGRGFNPARNAIMEVEPGKQGGYTLVTGRVRHAMRDWSGPYLTGLLHQFITFRPDVVFVMNEIFSSVYMQALVYRNVTRPSARVLFYGFENIIHPPATKKQRLRWALLRRWSDGGACANTEGLERIAGLGVRRDRLALTGWGVPLDQFTPGQRPDDDTVTIGYVGRLLEEKGLSTLMRAMVRLPDNTKLLCVGDGPWVSTFRQMIAACDLDKRVHHVGRVEDGRVARYMQAMNILVLPSLTTPGWKEQFGRVLPEAMACGAVVVGSSSGAIPEVIGDAGRVFPEGDADALAGVLSDLVARSDLRRQLADRGIRRAHEHYSCEAFAGKLANLFRQAASEGGRRCALA